MKLYSCSAVTLCLNVNVPFSFIVTYNDKVSTQIQHKYLMSFEISV